MEPRRRLRSSARQAVSVGTGNELGAARIRRTNQRGDNRPAIGSPPDVAANARTRSLHPGFDLQLESGLFEISEDHVHPAAPIPIRPRLVRSEIIHLTGGKALEI